MSDAKPKVSVEYASGAVVVTFMDEQILEEADISAIRESVTAVVEQTDKPGIILDFSNVRFLSSAVLGMLIRVSKMVYEKAGQLRLCSIHPKILEIFRITRLDRIFDIRKDAAAAIESLSA